MFGPLPGRRHDAFMLGVSGLTAKLENFNQPNGQPYVIYGDLAYGLKRNILALFRGAHLSPQQQDFNKEMSKVCVSVEWAFGNIYNFLHILTSRKITFSACEKLLFGGYHIG